MISRIRKETGKATWDEMMRFRRRLEDLERVAGAKVESLLRTGTPAGPVGGFTQADGDVRYLLLTAANDPVTGGLQLASTLVVDGAATLASSLSVAGLHTASDMIHISAPSTGVTSIRMRAGVNFTEMAPNNTLSLTGHELWFKEDGVTATDNTNMARWTSEATPFSGDAVNPDALGPIWRTSGGPSNLHMATFSTGNDNDMDTGSEHVFGGAGVGLTMFLVYRMGSVTQADQERGFVGRENTAGQRGGMRPPGNLVNNSSFAFMDSSDSGNKKVVSSTLSTEPQLNDWCLCVMRKDTSDVWFNALAILGGGIEEANDSLSDDGTMNIKAIGNDQSNSPFAGAAMAEFIGYQADIGDARMKDVFNHLANKYGFQTFANGGGGGGSSQTDFILAQNAAEANVFRVDTTGQVAIGGTTISNTLHVHGTAQITGIVTIGNNAVISGSVTSQALSVSGLSTLSDTDVADLTADNLDVAGRTTLTDTTTAFIIKATAVALFDNERIRFGNAKDARIFYDGSNLILQPRNVGTGDVRIDLDGTNEIRFGAASGGYIDRATNQNLNIQRISNGDLFLCRGGGGVVTGGNAPVAGASLTVKAGDLNIVSPGVLEGDRQNLQGGAAGIGADQFLNVPGGPIASATFGFTAQRAGSILGLGWSHDGGLITTDANITYQVRKNGVSVLANTAFSTVTSDVVTQARGVDTFVAGDILNFFVDFAVGFSGNIGFSLNADIIYDT